jgi:hypothetical protein
MVLIDSTNQLTLLDCQYVISYFQINQWIFLNLEDLGYDQKLNVITQDNLSTSSYATPVPNAYQQASSTLRPGYTNQQAAFNKVRRIGSS